MAEPELWDEFSERLRDLETAEFAPETISPFLALPGLRAFYPMSAIGTAGEARDLGGSGTTYDLTLNGNPRFYYDGLVPLCDYDGTGDYHSFVDNVNFDILGTETYILAAYRGLTIGGWFEFDDDPPAAEEQLIAKWDAGANRAYTLRRRVGTDIQFSIYDGVGVDSIDTVATTGTSQWYFCAGRYEPGAGPAEIAVFLKSENVNEIATNAVGIPAALQNSGSDFTIGASGTPGSYLDGRASLCFVCVEQLSNAILDSLFQQTRAAFGV